MLFAGFEFVLYFLPIVVAGPAGLTLANALLQGGEHDFVVLERESEAGGAVPLCCGLWKSI